MLRDIDLQLFTSKYKLILHHYVQFDGETYLQCGTGCHFSNITLLKNLTSYMRYSTCISLYHVFLLMPSELTTWCTISSWHHKLISRRQKRPSCGEKVDVSNSFGNALIWFWNFSKVDALMYSPVKRSRPQLSKVHIKTRL